jgi:hypothetical protein
MAKATLVTGTGLSVVLTAVSGIAINQLGAGWGWTAAVIISVGLTAVLAMWLAARGTSADQTRAVQVNSGAMVFAVQDGQQTVASNMADSPVRPATAPGSSNSQL